MEGSRQSQETLIRVLHILERMEARLDQHDERFRSLEGTNKQVNGLRPGEISVDGNGTAFDIPRPSSSSGSPDSKPEACKILQSISKVPYSEWSTKCTLPEQVFDTNLFKAIEHKVGDCLNIPDDYRLPLKFSKPNILTSNNPWPQRNPTRDLYNAKPLFERQLDTLCSFDRKLREQDGNDFVVIDFDTVNNSRIYRLGKQADGPELLVGSDAHDAPWSRFMHVFPGHMMIVS